MLARFTDLPDDLLLVIMEIMACKFPKSLIPLVSSFKRAWALYQHPPTKISLTRLVVKVFIGSFTELARSLVLIEGDGFRLNDIRRYEEENGALEAVKKMQENYGDQISRTVAEEKIDDMILKNYELDILHSMYAFHRKVTRAVEEAEPAWYHDPLYQHYGRRARAHRPAFQNTMTSVLRRNAARNARFYGPIDDMIKRTASWDVPIEDFVCGTISDCEED